MNKVFSIAVLILLIPALVWAGGSKDNSKREESSGSGVSLMEAIDLSADKIVEDIGPFANRIAEAAGKHRIAVVAFESESDALSDFIMAELSGALFDRNIEIVERQGLNWVIKELDFQMSGAVSDETMQSIGKFMGAELIVTGQLRHLGDHYRLTTNAIRVEQATRASIPRFDVRNDRAMQNMVAALANQTLKMRAADYGVTVDTKAETAGTFLDRGIQFAMRSEYDRAITDFTEALRLNPNLVGAYILRGRALTASVSLVTGIAENFSGVGTIFGFQITGEKALVYDRAIADFTQALRLDPDNAVIYYGRARTYAHKGDHDRAIADYTQAIRLNLSYSAAYLDRGNVYYLKRDYAQVLADANQAIRISPNDASAYELRGRAYRWLGDHDRAIAEFTEAIRLNPNGYSPYVSRGEVYMLFKNDLNRAIVDLTEAIRLLPDYATAYRFRAQAYLMKNNFNSAIADFTQVIIRLEHDDVNVYFFRGMAYMFTGDYERAIADLEVVLRIDPNNADARQGLEQARQARNRR